MKNFSRLFIKIMIGTNIGIKNFKNQIFKQGFFRNIYF